MNPTLKRYLVSSATTFLAAFFGMLAIQLQGGLPVDFSVATVIGMASAAVRAGFKALVEWGIVTFSPR